LWSILFSTASISINNSIPKKLITMISFSTNNIDMKLQKIIMAYSTNIRLGSLLPCKCFAFQLIKTSGEQIFFLQILLLILKIAAVASVMPPYTMKLSDYVYEYIINRYKNIEPLTFFS
jgi:uncharacterized membrane protein